MYGNYMHVDIIVHDALVICMSRIVYVAFVVHVTRYNMQWNLALHMHRDIALNGCECMVGKSTLHLVLIGWARLNGTTSNRFA